ncbi:MAG: hypothetical protein AAFZ15_12765 [Bacteroidota bacterium]
MKFAVIYTSEILHFDLMIKSSYRQNERENYVCSKACRSDNYNFVGELFSEQEMEKG